MNKQKILLADVLAETNEKEFREILLGKMLFLAGRRRRVRRFRQAATALAVLGLLGTATWRLIAPNRAAATPEMASYSSVRTVPLSASAIISTHQLDADYIITSVASGHPFRTTPKSGTFRNVDDAELLALASPRPAALVHIGPRSEKLVFITPGDENDLRLN